MTAMALSGPAVRVPKKRLPFTDTDEAAMSNWTRVCAAGDIEEEDLIRWDHDGRSFAIYRTESGYYATDGYCTHERQHLEDGLVIGHVIECPLHQGRFDVRSGKALNPPACEDLKTYPVKLEDGAVFIAL